MQVLFITLPTINGILIHGSADLHVTGSHDIAFVVVKLQAFLIPLKIQVIDHLPADPFLVPDQFLILHRQYLIRKKRMPMAHQTLVVTIKVTKFRQLEGGLESGETMKKRRYTVIQGTPLAVDDVCIGKQGFNQADPEEISRFLVRYPCGGGTV